MAIKAKQPHIRIDKMIWDDPVIVALSGAAFKSYIFAIAWSKTQNGRTPDGVLTSHGLTRVGIEGAVLEELVKAKLIEECEVGYSIPKYSDWQVTSEEERVLEERTEERRDIGRAAAAKRWGKGERPPLNPPEEGFDVEGNFGAAWDSWPAASDSKMQESRHIALEAFGENITNSIDYEMFSAALMNRIKDYKQDQRPKEQKRRYLGAFKNFCADRWRDWIPKSHRPPQDKKVLESKFDPGAAAPPVIVEGGGDIALPPPPPQKLDPIEEDLLSFQA